MTIWAGYYLRDPRAAGNDAFERTISRTLSRRPGDVAIVARFSRAALAYVETGALTGASARVDAGVSATIVAGEPLLPGSRAYDRDADITRLHDSWSRGDFALTAESAGTFAAVHYATATNSLSLIADRLGVRPIYFAVTDALIVVSNALRVLETFPALQKVVDVRGAVETIAFGHPLADRTPYRDVYAVRDGEIVTFRDREVHRRHYWRITSVAEERASLEEMAERVHAGFATAVERRLGSDRRGVAFLSGGLDSRCVVAELRARGVELHTFNFADEGTKDQILGDAFARAAGTIQSRCARPEEPIHWSMTMVEQWGASPHRDVYPVERPSTAWSGDGGSVGLGYVSVYPNVVELLRRGRRDEAAALYCRERGVALPGRLFRREIGAELRDVLQVGVRETLDEARSDGEPGRDLFFFRLQQGQRRHLALHFEEMDLHRLELHLPFHDADFIACVAAAPADYGLCHRLYHVALRHFPPVVTAVPWQTYPGHDPCPLPMSHDAIDQWSDRQKDVVRRRRRSTILGESVELLSVPWFPSPLIKRRYVAGAGLLHWIGRGDYAYVMDYAAALSALWKVSDGRWQLAAIERDVQPGRDIDVNVRATNSS